MIKLFIINSTFREEKYYSRWRLLKEKHPEFDITLAGPKKWKGNVGGTIKVIRPQSFKEERFEVVHINMPASSKWTTRFNGPVSLKLFDVLRKKKPDIVYMIGYETGNMIYEVNLAKNLFFPHGKLVGFTMRGIDMPMHIKRYAWNWGKSRKIYDALFCHYPHGMNVIKNQGKFEKPVYLQTQVGVNKDIYYKDTNARREIRNQYAIDQSIFLFGSLGRIVEAKGVFDIMEALPIKGNWRFMMIGTGRDFDIISSLVKQKGLENKVILTGGVKDGTEVAKHLNALDCLVHIPKTTKKWVDTFPLSVPEAMAVKLPIIGSDSGVIPYQLGGEGIIIKEGDTKALRTEMQRILDDTDMAKELGEQMYNRVIQTFEVRHLNKCLSIIFKEILKGNYNLNHVDQANFKF